jgi:hypothetical protein
VEYGLEVVVLPVSDVDKAIFGTGVSSATPGWFRRSPPACRAGDQPPGRSRS